jgi:heme exporter protein D
MIPHTTIHWETGKYAFFVWTAYGVTAAVFAILTVGSILHARRWRRRAEALARK